MDKKKKILLIVGGTIALYILAVLVYWIAVKWKEGKYLDEAPEKEVDGGSSGSVVGGSSKLPNFPLNEDVEKAKKYVRNVQVMCNTWAGTGIAKDGIWGNDTELAVQKLKRVASVKPKGGEGAFGSKATPFPQCIANVQVPLSDKSKTQIYVSRYNEIIRWHNENVNKYQPI